MDAPEFVDQDFVYGHRRMLVRISREILEDALMLDTVTAEQFYDFITDNAELIDRSAREKVDAGQLQSGMIILRPGDLLE